MAGRKHVLRDTQIDGQTRQTSHEGTHNEIQKNTKKHDASSSATDNPSDGRRRPR